MGKIKTKTIKRVANELLKKKIEFKDNFEENKQILEKTMPSKKIRNQIAGYLVRLKKREKEEKINLPKE